jgi:putative DNA methylase
MALYTAHARITRPDGEPLPIGEALRLVDQVVGETLDRQRERLDAGSRACLDWFERYAFSPGPVARVTELADRHGLSLPALVWAGVVEIADEGARLLRPDELAQPADELARPAGDAPAWAAVLSLAGVLSRDGASAAAALTGQLRRRVELASCHPLVFLLYRGCDRRNLPRVGAPFNALGSAWRDLLGETGIRP